jgi:hypothetical protein
MGTPTMTTLDIDVNEVVIDAHTGIAHPWNLQVGSGGRWPLTSVVIFLVFDVAHALLHGSTEWPHRGQTLTVTRDGFAMVVGPDGQQFLYELFPARFSNCHHPFEPKIYIGRWPD